jgi:hypothetical protein
MCRSKDCLGRYWQYRLPLDIVTGLGEYRPCQSSRIALIGWLGLTRTFLKESRWFAEAETADTTGSAKAPLVEFPLGEVPLADSPFDAPFPDGWFGPAPRIGT